MQDDMGGELAADPRCDFCSAPNPVWRYPADPFSQDVVGTDWLSVSDWAACDACAGYIEMQDAEKLARYSIEHGPLQDLPDWVREAVIERVTVLHQEFLTAINGPRERITDAGC